MSTITQLPDSKDGHPDAAGRRVLAVGAGVLLVALATGLFLAARGTPEYPPGSPEAVAQAYLQALLDQRSDDARALLSPELAARCGEGEPYSWWISTADAIRFSAVRVEGATARIDLELTHLDDYDPFEFPIDTNYRPERDAELAMELRDGTWLITATAPGLNSCHWR